MTTLDHAPTVPARLAGSEHDWPTYCRSLPGLRRGADPAGGSQALPTHWGSWRRTRTPCQWRRSSRRSLYPSASDARWLDCRRSRRRSPATKRPPYAGAAATVMPPAATSVATEMGTERPQSTSDIIAQSSIITRLARSLSCRRTTRLDDGRRRRTQLPQTRGQQREPGGSDKHHRTLRVARAVLTFQRDGRNDPEVHATPAASEGSTSGRHSGARRRQRATT